MDHDRSFTARLQRLLFPFERLTRVFICREDLTLELLLRVLFGVTSRVLQIKTDGKLEIKLDGAALVGSTQGILYLNVYFGAVKSTVPFF